jgi:hypothetical protein
MFTPLDETRLKTGETLQIGVVRGPDEEWAERLRDLLGHKSQHYAEHIRRSVAEPLDSLETRFYVGAIDGRAVAQVMIVGARGAGILGHVYTRPEERRKGACQEIFRRLMPDLPRAGFEVVCLGTGFDSPPYWIYHSFGFRGIAAGSGAMKWQAQPDSEERLLASGPSTVRDMRWDDWGYADLLAMQPVTEDESLPRAPTWNIKGQGSAEGPFVAFQVRRGQNSQWQAKALETAAGATVGWAMLTPDSRWFGDAWLLDLHAAPNFQDRLPELASALTLPDAPVVAYLTTTDGPKADALRGVGLQPATRLARGFQYEGRTFDLELWKRD